MAIELKYYFGGNVLHYHNVIMLKKKKKNLYTHTNISFDYGVNNDTEMFLVS